MQQRIRIGQLRKRRVTAAIVLVLTVIFAQTYSAVFTDEQVNSPSVLSQSSDSPMAQVVLDTLAVKGRAPKTGYTRAEFGEGWGRLGTCDMRNIMLSQQLNNTTIAEDGCIVLKGNLNDPYTGTFIEFVRGRTTSDSVQIDHVVALSDAWQKGAQALSYDSRVQFANDPLNLLAVEGKANQNKGDSDAASWLPPNRLFRCQYIARQIAVKAKYTLWVTEAEKAAMKRVLNGCGEQRIPEVG